MPLNLIGEIAKVVSISFRLYGNIMGGSIIILVVSYLVYGLIIPPFLYAFFGMFVGTVQAFVFTMLTLVYISVQVK
jgi:F-type H+-transporting ATPase subunit a